MAADTNPRYRILGVEERERERKEKLRSQAQLQTSSWLSQSSLWLTPAYDLRRGEGGGQGVAAGGMGGEKQDNASIGCHKGLARNTRQDRVP